LLETLPTPERCLADAACDSDALRAFLIARGTTPIRPNNPPRPRRRPYDDALYNGRNGIERAIARLRD
jgi:putative transposase